MWRRRVGWVVTVLGGLFAIVTIVTVVSSDVTIRYGAVIWTPLTLLLLSIGLPLVLPRESRIATPIRWFATIYGGILLLLVVLSVAMPRQMKAALGHVLGRAVAGPEVRAHRYYVRGDYARCIGELDRAIKQAPPNAVYRGELMSKRAQASLGAKQYSQAWSDFCISNALYCPLPPTDDLLSQMRAVLPQVTGVPVDEQGKNAFIHAEAALKAEMASDFVGAKVSLDEAIALSPDDQTKAALLYQRAYAIGGSNREQASADYREACWLAPILDVQDAVVKNAIDGKPVTGK